MKAFEILMCLIAVAGCVMCGVILLAAHPIITWYVAIPLAVFCAIAALFVYGTFMVLIGRD